MELRESLQKSLGAAYTLERELGGGGMSRVFLAHEHALNRTVVIKVLPPELASAVSGERFQREIQLAAQLQHPHIVPVLTAGQSGDLKYYAMPFVDGESLRDKLARSGEMPVADAVRVLRDVAAALSYAHKHNVVHRDIKPDNVLLSDGYAVVTDFGVAKAIKSSATGEGAGLTSLGVALGTPAYMSPEQAAAEPNVDHRSDIYSFGVLAYELLCGASPFAGRAMAAQLSAHINEAPESLARRRPNVPPPVVQLVERCLAKRPADRPQSADEVVRALDAVVPTPSQSLPSGRPRALRWSHAVGGLAVVGAVVAGVVMMAPEAQPIDDGVVAVFPFRVSSPNANLDYLREGGLPDLVSIKLSSDPSLRASDVGAVLKAWRNAGGSDLSRRRLARVAAGLGAGQLITGEAVGTPGSIVMRATLGRTSSGGEVDATVQGSPDSIASLVGQLTAQLLARRAGESESRITELTHTTLAALRPYLDGNVRMRQGNYSAAQRLYMEALRADSALWPALVGAAKAYAWAGPTSVRDSLRRAGWAHRNKLSVLDRLYMEAAAGARSPGYTPYADRIAAAERFAAAAPENAEGWAMYADYLYHHGSIAGVPNALIRSRSAFERAFKIDSTFAPVLDHLPQLYHALGDTAARRHVIDLLLARDSAERQPFVAWFAAALRDDSAGMLAVPATANGPVVGSAMNDAVGIRDVERRIAAMNFATISPAVFRDVVGRAYRAWLANTGRPQALRRARIPLNGDTIATDVRIFDILFWDGDSTEATQAVANIMSRRRPGQLSLTRLNELFQLALWRLDRGQSASVHELIGQIRVTAQLPDTVLVSHDARAVLTALETVQAHNAGSANAIAMVARLDSIARRGAASQTIGAALNLISARLWEKHGNLPNALGAVRRKDYNFNSSPAFHSTLLREEGRLAEATGDREGAIRAYSMYLALRYKPEPSLQPEVDRIRARLDALKRESSGR